MENPTVNLKRFKVTYSKPDKGWKYSCTAYATSRSDAVEQAKTYCDPGWKYAVSKTAVKEDK